MPKTKANHKPSAPLARGAGFFALKGQKRLRGSSELRRKSEAVRASEISRQITDFRQQIANNSQYKS